MRLTKQLTRYFLNVRLLIAVVCAVFVIPLAPLHAQTGLVLKEEIKANDKKTIGWKNTASLGLNISFASNSNLIGQIDGQTQTYGLNLKSEFDEIRERSEWRNTIGYTGATSKNPTLDQFSKSSDELKVETLYLYSLESAPKFGPYAKGSASTSVFRGDDVRAQLTTYNITNRDGTTGTVNGTSLQLTDGFRPLTTLESIGGFWKPIERDDLRVEARLGFGAQQINANGEYSVTGSGPGGSVSVNELKNVNQAGLEAAVNAKGKIDEKSGYEASVQTLTPFVNDRPSSDDRSAVRLTNVEGRVKLTSKMTSWASFAYDYKLILQPQLVDRTQQAHMLLLNINYNLL